MLPSVVDHAFNSTTQRAEGSASLEFEASPGCYMVRPCFKTQTESEAVPCRGRWEEPWDALAASPVYW